MVLVIHCTERSVSLYTFCVQRCYGRLTLGDMWRGQYRGLCDMSAFTKEFCCGIKLLSPRQVARNLAGLNPIAQNAFCSWNIY